MYKRQVDNRGGCTVLLELAHTLTAEKRPSTVWLVGTVLEEYNLRGAMVASRTVKPDIAIALDGGGGSDTPDLKGMGPTGVGKGPVMTLYLSLIHISIAENIMMYSTVAEGKPLINAKKTRERAVETLQKIHFDIDPDLYVSELNVAQKQMVAICRAIVQDAKLLVMDEPTTALTTREVEKLFEVVRKLKRDVYKRQLTLQRRKRLCDRISSAIIAAAAVVFVSMGVAGLWHPGWVALPIGGILCAVVWLILDGGRGDSGEPEKK